MKLISAKLAVEESQPFRTEVTVDNTSKKIISRKIVSGKYTAVLNAGGVIEMNFQDVSWEDECLSTGGTVTGTFMSASGSESLLSFNIGFGDTAENTKVSFDSGGSVGFIASGCVFEEDQ